MKAYQAKPCAECPWRTDVAPGQFPPKRFIALAETAYDMALVQFACHKSKRLDIGCAGFVLRGSLHNLGMRFALRDGRLDIDSVSDGGCPLHSNYRSMAIANGVREDHPTLRLCRDDAARE